MKNQLRTLPRNIWAVSMTSFMTDISSEMILNLLPLFLSNVLGVKTNVIGLIEGTAEAISSLLKVFSGWLSDRLRARKWLAVAGYAASSFSKPFFYIADSWGIVASARWADRVGKGIRTAPRDALVADSIDEGHRGFAFGFHRAADTAGAFLGILIAIIVVWVLQKGALGLARNTFQTIVLISLVPAFLGVLVLSVGARDIPVTSQHQMPRFAFRSLGRQFSIFMLIVGIFELGNSSDAFLVLRANERGISVVGVLGMLLTFNLIYALVSTPAGLLSDRIGRRGVIIGGWLLYALIYLGFALAKTGWQVWGFYALYGIYYGLAYGTAKALVADIVPPELRGTAFGTYSAIMGVLDLISSIIAGILWQGIGGWQGFGPAAPFFFGGATAFLATFALAIVGISRVAL